MLKSIFLTLTLIIFPSNASGHDFCVADLTGPPGPSGYPCKIPEEVTVSDFVFTRFRRPGNTTNPIQSAITPAFDAQFPGLNGLGLSMARIDLAPGGVVPMHSHPGASEVLVVVHGSIITGFVSSANNLYVRKLWRGDVMVIPQGLLHFQFNGGGIPALAFASFNNANPGIQITDLAFFPNDYLSSAFLDDARVKKLLKAALLGGTG